ncbi:clathrin coat assembly protein AP180 [Cucumis melo var. makuwa]|uniref:Clathrin coat assembly protein AP180 n=2 Tax=Cucumis melo TaxID=3656 RepID=A0A5D3C685_CUCMM|nr:clathrin coat assembly protein AP180 [Cucumis melo var. makuwa]TYK05856.1 clathrin coat assembly protein AP180 [Cucumis melo var. makuwa]
MPSKLRKALYAVKDQTSIGLAKVSSSAGGPNATSLEVAVLKATTHDDVPLDHRYVNEILTLISANKSHAAACAHSIAKRITKTRNWTVALKSLNLVLKIFQDGDPYFPREVLHAMKRGAKILNLSNFRDDSNSSPWDYTAFVRTFALYLDERLDCFLTGKLQKRFTQRKTESYHATTRRINEPIRDMKPAMLIDRITYWQKLLDRAIATRPTGPAKGNRLVQHSLHAVVQESFDLYRDISDGLALLLDSFFHLQYQSCVNAFQACVKAAKQFEELGSFYDLCKSIGVGRTSEYPSVQQPSDELIETLQEFLKDQASFPCHGNRSPPQAILSVPMTKLTDDLEQSESSDKNSERGSDFNSVGDIMSATGSWTSPANSVEQDGEGYSDYQSEKQSRLGDFANESNLSPNFAFFEENGMPFEEESQFGVAPSLRFGDWELVLAESATASPKEWPDFFSPSIGDDLFAKPFSPQHHYKNPFLQDSDDLFTAPPTFKAEKEMGPTFRAENSVAPTFRAETATLSSQNENRGFDELGFGNDPFAGPLNGNDQSFDEESLLQQQKLWKEQQNKIIAKHTL